MALKSNLVNLDAMIKREDFASADTEATGFENVSTISLRDFTSGGLIGPSLRKPDFQRETNHWGAEQIVSLLHCFINGDLIPSVILWQSPTYLFVIDGGHRLSALRAWVEDDYGDGPISQAFFDYEISDAQLKAATRTRNLVNKNIGSWQHNQAKINDQLLNTSERKLLNAIVSRGLPIQWVKGDADKAESSFFMINTKGTPLDDIEELLLKNRKKPISIAARAIIRAGKGHRYWSSFTTDKVNEIETLANELHSVLFDPEIRTPIKTLDLPLGGPKGVRMALKVLIDVILISIRNHQSEPKQVSDTASDSNGDETIATLKKALKLAKRITGNDKGSLGLHPAVYFYGPSGRHSGAMFMGTLLLIRSKLLNNDDYFFKKFTAIRGKLEIILIEQKDLIATILQKLISNKRDSTYASMLDKMILDLYNQMPVNPESIVIMAGLDGKVITGKNIDTGKNFSDDTKGEVFIRSALKSALKCPICDGYIDAEKSISYDHIIRVEDEGTGHVSNAQLTHPYCNQSIKN